MISSLPLFLIIFLEGYVVLSTELLAIRMLIPFTGSGTDTVSIIIAAILMPLAFGYFAGGGFRPSGKISVRTRLIKNLTIASAILSFGLSYTFLNDAFEFTVNVLHITNRLYITSLYSLIFLVYPVFLLGQTVPLIGHYFSRERLPVMAGRILFFSTMGSFMGAVFCTLVLMAFAGVHNAVIVTIGCMVFLVFLLNKNWAAPSNIIVTLCLAATLAMNSPMMLSALHIIKDNKYNTIGIRESAKGDARYMILNRTSASAVYIDGDDPYFAYTKFIEENFLMPLTDDKKIKSVLVLGAGGFTMGRTDKQNNYLYVDIDKDLKENAEKYLLQEKLTPNKKFQAIEARAFLNQTKDKYDIIVLDLYRDPVSVPEYLITKEFFQNVKNHLKDGGVMVGNYFASPSFGDPYSIKLDNTLRAVFPNLNRQAVKPMNIWERSNDWANIVYSAVNYSSASSAVYSDDKNSSIYDKPAVLLGKH